MFSSELGIKAGLSKVFPCVISFLEQVLNMYQKVASLLKGSFTWNKVANNVHILFLYNLLRLNKKNWIWPISTYLVVNMSSWMDILSLICAIEISLGF